MYDEHTCGAEIPTAVMINDFFKTVKGGGPINGRDNKTSADKYRNMLENYLAAASKNILENNNTPSLEQFTERKGESTRILRIGGMYMEPDHRLPLQFVGGNPQVPWMMKEDVDNLRKMIKSAGNGLFEGLVGGRVRGKSKRSFTPNLANFPDLYKLVEKCMAPYISWVQEQQPLLKYYKLAIVRSDVGAGSQYEGCGRRLHSDYFDCVNKRPPLERPMSLLVALDEFEFMYLWNRQDSREKIDTITVRPGIGLAFTNYCLHAGGKNKSGKVCFRLFAYLVRDPVDYPNGEINYGIWKTVTKGNEMDDIIDESVIEIPVRDAGIKRNRSGHPRYHPNEI